jgi:hypothetical protein
MRSSRPAKKAPPVGTSFPVTPCAADVQLLKLLSSARYDQINHEVSQGVCGTYRRQLSSACQDLLDNEVILTEISSPRLNEADQRSGNALGGKRPEDMSGFELFQAIASLKLKVDELQKVTETAKSDLEILEHAENRFKLELGFKVVELKSREQRAYDVDEL